ncbi:PilC/PilY family type IV pilus protein [Variovorax paradoxus]|uniref:PilC/PilY family type IV pilus protein n=1 Tax=Variovorax paradoxus TaxID=34073 RepID=UPI0024809B86|nr:PilC/PilY family type IV pilus protein [Variovorax paradoxus]WGT63800.1 PilC/PilY family type IV pilus protein [Variovorax paradoxus]
MKARIRSSVRAACRATIATGLGLALGSAMVASAIPLANQPVFSTSEVPGNLALALSVEWPTASRTAHVGNYSSNTNYLGYFDPAKCYLYQVDATANGVSTTDKGDSSYFYPAGAATNRTCTGDNDDKWSGNFLNWASTATIDPFRWAMTGGRRVVDTATTTILEKAWHGDRGLFPDRTLPAAAIAGATPFNNATALGTSITNRGFKMRVTANGGGAGRTMTAQYFNNVNLNGTVIATVAADTANHDWGNAAPVNGVNADNFSARFIGTYTAPVAGDYVFRTISDDGVRLWVNTSGNGGQNFTNGNRRINNWTDHGSATDDSETITLTAGQTFSVQIEYYEKGGGAVMQFLWRTPTSNNAFVPFSDAGPVDSDYTMRVKVCDPSAAAGGLEANCKAYGSNYKPEGLIQKYADKMRFSAFGYLNDSSDQRDGGVLRARQKFVGPTAPTPGQAPAANANKEWSETDGTFIRNPDAADATATGTATGVTISDSGVMNYLNKFGQILPGDYKSYDPVSELYYAVIRYYKNLGNVDAWSSMGTAGAATKTSWVDGFPVITNWGDPIQYSCQRNFVLGIGDIYTHVDKNVAGNTTYRTREPAMQTEVANDNTVNAVTATNRVGALQGLGNLGNSNDYSGRNNSAYIAGLAFDSNTKDIRPDVAGQANTIGKQTVSTYWVDVLEQPFQFNNQFYLAAKFGGLDTKKLPADFDPYTFAGTIPLDWWSTNGETLTDTRAANLTQPRPDNYFAAGQPDTLVRGLTQAFERIVNAIQAYTTSFSLSALEVSATGSASYASQYDAQDWTGVVSASSISFATDGTPTLTAAWNSTTTLATQFAGTGWNTDRRIATWNGTAGVAFRIGNLTTGTGGQAAALDTLYVTGDDSANYLNYLRGDRSQEKTASDGTKPYRLRSKLLGDIVNSKVKPVGPPASAYSDAVNRGYAAFKTARASRPTMVYAAANDGMLHAFRGELDGTNAGREQFAYVPSALFNGPSSPAAPATDGLAQLGNPNYLHKYYVDATPEVVDVDFDRAGGTFAATGSNWRSLLVGGLGKGGKSFYALDVTDPAAITDETVLASKVLWEFTDADMGFSYGAPLVLKTKRYGWVVVLTSGYHGDNTDRNGYIYFVHPRTGALLQKISTGATANGLTHATAFIPDLTDGTADAIYVGDLNGQLWRFDVTAAAGTAADYPAPAKIALFTDGATTPAAQPITSRPLVQIQPTTRKRYVMVGTGRLLDASDINSAATQSFYAVIDGTDTAFKPADNTMPVTRSGLTAVTNLVSGTVVPTDSRGWYIDLGSQGSIGLRMLASPTAFNGIVAFSSLLTSGDACSPSGQSRIYAIDYNSGRTALASGAAFVQSTTAITDLKFVGVDGTVRLISGDVRGNLDKIGFNPPAGTALRLLNWREVPTAD